MCKQHPRQIVFLIFTGCLIYVIELSVVELKTHNVFIGVDKKKNFDGGVKKKMGITLGDPNGIGPEVILKTLDDSQLRDTIIPVLYGSHQVLSFYYDRMSLAKIEYKQSSEVEDTSSSSVHLVDCLEAPLEIVPGQASTSTAEAARIFLDRGLKDLKKGVIDGLVTGPIDKNTIYGNQFPYRGHTEYLAEQLGVKEPLMMMVGRMLKVALVTEHMAIHKVAHAITSQRLTSKIHLFEHSLKQDFRIEKPRIAVLGLNPHAGDGGLIGAEEDTLIGPVVQDLKRQGKSIFGPFAADGFFASAEYKHYDGVLAMYHDQGLIPFKLLAFDHGVNYTAGLPITRTSPDHGVAYAIAGENKADENAMKQAIYLALSIIRNKTAAL